MTTAVTSSVSGSEAPFPWARVLVVAFIAFSSCFSVTYVFPIVPYIVLDLGMVSDPREPGLYSGYLSSASIAGSTISGIPWGKFADHYGRRLPLQLSMLCIAVTSVLFGVSTNFWWSVALRFLQGALNCTFIVARVMIPDICEPSQTPRAMGIVQSTWGFALIAGPAASGFLSHPERTFPVELVPTPFIKLPYLLPTLFSAALCLAALCLIWFFLPPTTEDDAASYKSVAQAGKTEGIAHEDAYGDGLSVPMRDPVGDDDDDDDESQPLVAPATTDTTTSSSPSSPRSSSTAASLGQPRESLWSFCQGSSPSQRAVRLCILLDLLRGFYVLGDDNSFPLLAAAPVSANGLGYSAPKIGAALGIVPTSPFLLLLVLATLNLFF